MGLRQQVKDGVNTVLAALGDLKSSVEYHVVDETGYNPATGSQTVTDTSTTCLGFIYKGKYKVSDSSGIEATGTKVMIAADDIPGVTPKLSDYLVIATKRWEIIQIDEIPTSPGFIFVVRLP